MATAPAAPAAGLSSWRLLIRSSDAPDPTPASPSISLPLESAAGSPPDDLEIVRAVLEGDREAFRLLVDRESTPVIRACFRVLGSLPEAEDVAQEAFVTAYRSLATWRGDGPFGAWLSRIAVRLAVRQLGRRRAVAWIRPGNAGAESGLSVERIVAALPAESRTQPEHAVISAERATATRRAVADLEEPYREVVALRFFGERSLEEIAAVTGRPLGTVKTHLRRGLLRLRDRLDQAGLA